MFIFLMTLWCVHINILFSAFQINSNLPCHESLPLFLDTLASSFSGTHHHLFLHFLKLILFYLKFSSLRIQAICIITSSLHSNSTFSVQPLQTTIFAFTWTVPHSPFSAQFSVPLFYYSMFFSFRRSFCLLTFHEIYLHMSAVYFFLFPVYCSLYPVFLFLLFLLVYVRQLV